MTTWIIVGVCVLSIILFWESGWGALAFLILCLTGVVSCQQSDWSKERDRQVEIQRKEDEKPRIVRSVDDCNVYAFKVGDRWHYFTKCGKTTTTETTYKESCGKSCSREKSEFIVTENK